MRQRGVFEVKKIQPLTEDLRLVVLLDAEALPRMQAGAAIINTASIQAFDPSPNLLAYAPTKGAIVNFTKALSQMAMKNPFVAASSPLWISKACAKYSRPAKPAPSRTT